MSKDDFQELISKLSSTKKLQHNSDMLAEALRKHGLANVCYIALNLPSVAKNRPILATTYQPAWQKHYSQHRYVDIDPLLRAGLGGILPVDWNEIDRSSPFVAKFFGEAQELQVGLQGLSIPVRGRHGEFALFTVSSNVSSREWVGLKSSLMRDLMLLAWNFHANALRIEGIDHNEFAGKLSPRQAACLRWMALGKTEREAAQILGVSPATVKFHLELARSNLGVVNTTHAVARALTQGLINMAIEPNDEYWSH